MAQTFYVKLTVCLEFYMQLNFPKRVKANRNTFKYLNTEKSYKRQMFIMFFSKKIQQEQVLMYYKY